MRGGNTVFFAEFFGVKEYRLCIRRKYNACLFGYKLKRIAVSREYIDVNIFFFAHRRERSEYIVRLESLFFYAVCAYCLHKIVCVRALDRELVGHTVTVRFVLLINFVSESRRFHIECYGKIIGGKLVYVAAYYIDHAVNGVCGKSRRRCERAHTVKRTV